MKSVDIVGWDNETMSPIGLAFADGVVIVGIYVRPRVKSDVVDEGLVEEEVVRNPRVERTCGVSEWMVAALQGAVHAESDVARQWQGVSEKQGVVVPIYSERFCDVVGVGTALYGEGVGGSSRPRDQTLVSCIAGRFFTI